MTRMLLRVGLVLALVLAPAVVEAQGPPDRAPRRDQLEQQVRQQFLARVADRLELTDSQREQMLEVLREGADARQALAQESRELRHDLMQAVRSEDTPMGTYQDLLERLEAIRERERAIEQREASRLARVLDPRQEAIFLIMRMEFNNRIRGMRRPGRGMGPGGADLSSGPMLMRPGAGPLSGPIH